MPPVRRGSARMRSHRVFPALVLLAGSLLSVLVVILLTWEPVPSGLPDPGPFVDHGLPLTRALLYASAVAAVGFALLPVFLATDERTSNSRLQRRSLDLSAAAGLLIAVCAVLSLFLGAVELNPEPGPMVAEVSGYLIVSRTGQALAAMVVLSLLLTVMALACRHFSLVPRELCLLLSLTLLLPLTLTGHGEGSVLHGLMMLSRIGHVVGVAVWVGGLLALVCLLSRHGGELAEVLPRFSLVASWAVGAVALTGVIDAFVVLFDTAPEGFRVGMLLSPYVLLCVAKLGCVGVLLPLAFVIRFRLLPRIRAGHRTALVAWTTAELAVMGIALGLAVVLARTPVLP